MMTKAGHGTGKMAIQPYPAPVSIRPPRLHRYAQHCGQVDHRVVINERDQR